jgi:hypothetical protein
VFLLPERTDVSQKARLLERLQAEQLAWKSFINHIPSSRREVPGAAGEWSVKDIVGHVTAYERFLADRLKERRKGITPQPSQTPEELEAFLAAHDYPDFSSPLLDDDEANAIIVQANDALSWGEIRLDAQRVFQRMLDEVRAIPEEHMTEAIAALVASNTYEHYHHHTADIQAWLERDK